MLNIVIILVAVLLGGYLAFSKRLAGSSNWQATITPLASIMGSGFLALFYMLQCAVAFIVAWQLKDLSRRPLRLATFAFLAMVCFLVFTLGIPSG